MERAIIFACLCVTIDCSVLKYYKHFTSAKTWSDAQAFCRWKGTDLAFVQSEDDQLKFREVARNQNRGWIGLYRDSTTPSGWTWSGGWYVTFTSWSPTEPNNVNEIAVAADGQGLWYDYTDGASLPFYCVKAFNLTGMEKSWEEALEHCRRNGSDLVTVSGEHKHSRMKSLMEMDAVDRVWVGLRFLGDHWLWLGGSLKMDLPWAEEENLCPLMNRCGALNKDGLLESRDCQERLHFVCL